MSAKAKRLLTMSSRNLDYFDRKAIWKFLEAHPELKELYGWKERMFALYRTKGHKRAAFALDCMLQDMENSKLPEIRTLKRTLTRWKNEILNYFINRLTNARTEGFNNVAKLVQKRGSSLSKVGSGASSLRINAVSKMK
jgi:transposase